MKKILLFAMLSLFTFSYSSAQVRVASSGQGNVTFSVDMSNYSGTFFNVYVSGNFNNWCGICNPMTHQGGNIYSTTVSNVPAGEVEYLFNVDNMADQESFSEGSSCTKSSFGFVNRLIYVVDGDNINLPTVEWNGTASGACPTISTVTFCVDMSQYSGSGNPATDGVFLNGDFNDWCGTCWELTNQGDDIWCGTFNVGNTELDYKFTVGNFVDLEDLEVGSPCTKVTDGFNNRVITVTGDATLPTALWGSCSARQVIPTMSEWGLVIFGLLILNLGLIFISRKEQLLVGHS